MYKNKKILAVIPARGGSKRLPGKNIKDLCGKPLIAWTIDSALKSNLFDEVMVNTDDIEIAEISKGYGATVPFIRSTELATDTASSMDVVIQTVNFYLENEKNFDIVLLLQPTSPLRTSQDIINAINLYLEKNANSVLSVCEVDHPVQWSNTLNDSLSMDSFIRESIKGKRSQDLETNYRLNGAIYIWDSIQLLQCRETIISPSFAYVMNRKSSVDIDEEIDFKYAKLLLGEERKNVR